jgi:hypothetical protein
VGVVVEVVGTGGLDVGEVDNMGLAGEVGELRVPEHVEMVGVGEPDGEWEANERQVLDLEAEEVEDEDEEEVATELVQLEPALALEVGSRVAAE